MLRDTKDMCYQINSCGIYFCKVEVTFSIDRHELYVLRYALCAMYYVLCAMCYVLCAMCYMLSCAILHALSKRYALCLEIQRSLKFWRSMKVPGDP
jgi:uncharacterized membrane protein